MKKVRFALAGAICLIVLGIAAIVALGWRSSQTVQSKNQQPVSLVRQKIARHDRQNRTCSR